MILLFYSSVSGWPTTSCKVEAVAPVSQVNSPLLTIHVQRLVKSSKLRSSNQSRKKSDLQCLANSSNLNSPELKIHVQRRRRCQRGCPLLCTAPSLSARPAPLPPDSWLECDGGCEEGSEAESGALEAESGALERAAPSNTNLEAVAATHSDLPAHLA